MKILDISESFLQSALDALKQEIFSSLRVAMPGIIVAYDTAAGLALVQPAVRRRTSSGQILTAPILRGVPVLRPSADFIPSPGDRCILLFMDFCLDGWLESGQPVLPPFFRQHDLSDAIALTGYGFSS